MMSLYFLGIRLKFGAGPDGCFVGSVGVGGGQSLWNETLIGEVDENLYHERSSFALRGRIEGKDRPLGSYWGASSWLGCLLAQP